ncbi:SIR2 family protein [Candidatus Neomarinimicrobiota bacterium]
MIKENTVFVLGAGASKPYGFPTGIELRQEIIEQFEEIMARIALYEREDERLLPKPNKIFEFVQKFKMSDNNSIDLFLTRHREDETMVLRGKLAITTIMRQRENNEHYVKGGFLVEPKEHDWYNYLYEKMTDSMPSPENLSFSSNKATFITFNYDRSLEYYLHRALTSSFPDEYSEQLIEQLNTIDFFHVHGSLGALGWQNNTQEPPIHYATEIVDARKLLAEADRIKVVSETELNEDIQRARAALSEAEQIFFLGFGFAPENMDILDIPETIASRTQIYGTALGLTKREQGNIANRFAPYSQVSGKFRLIDTDSRRLLRDWL